MSEAERRQVRLLAGLHILVVEDMCETALSLSSGLRRAGGAASVEVKASVWQARQRLMVQPVPDMVLLDNVLIGEESGLDLALWMREQPHLQHTIRISYSGSDLTMLQARCPDDTVFHGWIIKPVPLTHLIDQLARFIRCDAVTR